MGKICDYLGVKVGILDDDRIKISQPHLIDQILNYIAFGNASTKLKYILALSSKVLDRDINGSAYKDKWEYRSIVVKINYLDKSTHRDLVFPIHQCEFFSMDPNQYHSDSINKIVLCLSVTLNKGVIIYPQ